jgi:hypothetical protein
MSQPNDSVTVTPGAGATIATHTQGGKEFQVVMLADETGHLAQTLPTYSWWVPVSAAGASKLYADIFNGSTGVLEIRGLWAIPRSDTAVTATLGIEIGLYRTSAVGTGGTVQTYNGGSGSTGFHVITPYDTTNTALSTSSNISARAVPTGGATSSALWWAQYVWTEETNAPATALSAYTNLLPTGLMAQRITLNPSQGLLIKQGVIAGAGNLCFLGQFTYSS